MINKETIITLTNKFKDDDYSAATKLGIYYASQMVCTYDYPAVKWLKIAIKYEQPEAEFWLGFMFNNGRGVTENHNEAKKLYKASSEKGNLDGISNYGIRVEGIHQNSLNKYIQINKVEILDLSCMEIRDQGLKIVCNFLPLSQIRNIHLKRNFITSEGVKLLSEIIPKSKLQIIDLWENNITCEGIIELAKKLPGTTVEVLDVACNKISDRGVVALSNILPLTNIKILHLGNNNITGKSGHAIGEAIQFSKLIMLDLGKNMLGSFGALGIANGIINSKLKILDISCNNISDLGYIKILEQAKNSILISLDVKQNNISDSSILYSADVFSSSRLENINLRNNQITEIGSIIFDKLPICLSALNLRGNNIGDAGLILLSSGLYGSNVETLNLSNVNATSIGVKILFCILSKTNITTLNLSGNKLNDNIIRYLSFLTKASVIDLDISGNQFSLEGIYDMINKLQSSSLKRLVLTSKNLSHLSKNNLSSVKKRIDQSKIPEVVFLNSFESHRNQRPRKNICSTSFRRTFSVAISSDISFSQIIDKVRHKMQKNSYLIKDIIFVSESSYYDLNENIRYKLGMKENQRNLVFDIIFHSSTYPLIKKDVNVYEKEIYAYIHENNKGYFRLAML